MKSQLRLVMRPEDETAVVATLLGDARVRFIDGPRWKSSAPATAWSLSTIGRYCIIWSPDDLPHLEAEFIEACGDWYCRSEHATIQFLRSEQTSSAITEGRSAISTDPTRIGADTGVERRFKMICQAIKKTYRNSLIEWHNKGLQQRKTPSDPATHRTPDRSLWIGPAAQAWLSERPERRVKQSLAGSVEGGIVPASS